MSHTIGIVGHKDRGNMVDSLAAVVRPDIPPSIDDGTLGCEGNHRRVWSQLVESYPESRWAVVLEDDALPVNDFDVQLEAALRVAPAPVVSLYLGRLRPRRFQAAIAHSVTAAGDAHWLVSKRLLHCVAVAIRVPVVGAMLAYTSRLTCPIDEAISKWAVASRLTVAYTWPSLVDHADEPTVIAHGRPARQRGRVAWRCGTRDYWRDTTASLRIR